MNPILAAGLSDQPWIVAAVIIVGAVINWLSQRRQEKQQRPKERQSQEPAPVPPKNQGEFDMEEALRRLLGEDTPRPNPAPPPIPRTGAAPPPPPARPRRVTTPIVLPPPVAVALVDDELRKVSDVEGQAALRFAQTDEQIQHHLVRTGPGSRVRGSKWPGLWRDRASVRRAFVGSLVFGPPKGLES
ncbi:MAG: hypothetical protein U1F83_08870 [Verrucomicrobiota bacterium]